MKNHFHEQKTLCPLRARGGGGQDLNGQNPLSNTKISLRWPLSLIMSRLLAKYRNQTQFNYVYSGDYLLLSKSSFFAKIRGIVLMMVFGELELMLRYYLCLYSALLYTCLYH